MKRQTELLAELCNALSVSGDEQEVREIVLREVNRFASRWKWTRWGTCWPLASVPGRIRYKL